MPVALSDDELVTPIFTDELEAQPFWILGFDVKSVDGLADIEREAIAKTGVKADFSGICPSYASEADAVSVGAAMIHLRPRLRVYLCSSDDERPIASISSTLEEYRKRRDR